MDSKKIGLRLKQFRRFELKKAQHELEQYGIYQTDISRAENGNESSQMKLIEVYVKNFNQTRSYFLGSPDDNSEQAKDVDYSHLKDIIEYQRKYIVMLESKVEDLQIELNHYKQPYSLNESYQNATTL